MTRLVFLASLMLTGCASVQMDVEKLDREGDYQARQVRYLRFQLNEQTAVAKQPAVTIAQSQ